MHIVCCIRIIEHHAAYNRIISLPSGFGLITGQMREVKPKPELTDWCVRVRVYFLTAMVARLGLKRTLLELLQPFQMGTEVFHSVGHKCVSGRCGRWLQRRASL